MINIEVLAHKIAEKISFQLDYDDEKQAVIAYGLIGLLQIITILVILTTIGVIFDFWYENMIIYLSVGFIRKSTGGAHSRSMNGCIVISVLSITLMSALSRFILNFPISIWTNFGISIIIFFLSFIVFYILVPVDNPNKPIVKPEKIKRLRKQSFIKLILLFFLSIVFLILAVSYNRFYSILFSVRLTILWLMLTLTKTGTLFLDRLDSKINLIIEKR